MVLRSGPDVNTKSLLYLVSGVFEPRPDEALLGLARFLEPAVVASIKNDDAQVESIAFVQRELARRFGGLSTIFIQTPTDPLAPLGRRSLAIDHMAFAEDPASLTIESVAYLTAHDSWP